jgi:hypothetical protein
MRIDLFINVTTELTIRIDPGVDIGPQRPNENRVNKLKEIETTTPREINVELRTSRPNTNRLSRERSA